MYENVDVEIWRTSFRSKKYLIGSIYRPPTVLIDDLTRFINEFSEYLYVIGSQYQRAYISGDTNINLLKINGNQHYNSFYDNVIMQGYIPHITLPTRLSDTCDTLIYNIFANNVGVNHVNGVLSHVISDHQITFSIILGCNYAHSNDKFIEVESINQRTIENFRDEIINMDIYTKLDQYITSDPNENCKIILQSLLSAKNKHMPKKLRKFNKRKDKRENWMTDELLNQINRKNYMYVDWKYKSKSVDIYNTRKTNFKTYERIVNKNIQEAKRVYYFNSFKNFKTNIKKAWKTINDTLGRNKKESHLPISVFHENRHITNIIANMYNDYFINIGKNVSTNLNGNISYKNYLKMPSKTTCHLERVTTSDVESMIDKLKNKSSSGYDGISNTILKSIKSVIINPLTLIINQMVETGIFSDVLKISKGIPIYKKGDVSLLSNYRPISLLPTLSKIFERVIYNQLYNYFVDNSLLTEHQFGFRAKHSTELATIRLVDYINKEMDKKHTPVKIYLDLLKAFDTIHFEV